MSSQSIHTIRDVRIGNDLVVNWTILTNGKPLPLEGRDLTLTLTLPHGSRQLTDFTVRDNMLSWVFPGREQRFTGEYMLTLSENKGLPGMATVDQRGFRLVGRMFGTNGLLNEPEEVQLDTADIGVAAGMYDLATEERDGLMPKEDKQLVDQLRQTIIDIDDEEIHSWFYGEQDSPGDSDSSG